jgi:hypothetical protein
MVFLHKIMLFIVKVLSFLANYVTSEVFRSMYLHVHKIEVVFKKSCKYFRLSIIADQYL